MEVLKRLIENAKNIDINSLVQEILNYDSIQDLIIDLNTQKQLFEKGIDIEGEVVGYYSYATEHFYRGGEIGKFEGEHYNFDNTGDLFRSFSVKSYYKHFEIDADTAKMQDNKNIRDKKIIGLTENSLQILIDAISPILVKKIIEGITRW